MSKAPAQFALREARKQMTRGRIALWWILNPARCLGALLIFETTGCCEAERQYLASQKTHFFSALVELIPRSGFELIS